ncbi:MFS transporter, partial [bacterium]|nr:MFS transporter [bacterium]
MGRKRLYFYTIITGASGFLFAVMWLRMFWQYAGKASLVSAAFLSAYMLGTAAGSFLFGRIAEKREKHFFLFALTQFGLGASVIIITYYFSFFHNMFSFLCFGFGSNELSIGLSIFYGTFLIMFIPTMLLGGTFPLINAMMMRYNTENISGRIYGLLGIGAALGIFCAVFFIVRFFGLYSAVYLFAGLNVLIGYIAWLVRKKEGKIISGGNDLSVGEDAETTKPVSRLLYITACCSGLLIFAYGTLWSGAFSYIFGTTLYSLGITFTVFLVWFAFGGFIGSAISERFNRNTVLAVIQIFIGLGALVTISLLTSYPAIYDTFGKIFGTEWRLSRYLVWFGSVEIVIFIPTFLLGVLFPSVLDSLKESVKKTHTGSAFALHIIGGVIGLCLARCFIIPVIGIPKGIMFLAFINLILGGSVFCYTSSQKRLVKIIAGTAVIIICGVYMVIINKDQFVHLIAEPADVGEVTYFDDTLSGTVIVREYPEYYKKGKKLSIDGVSVSGTSYEERTAQKLLGYLPVLIKNSLTDNNDIK